MRRLQVTGAAVATDEAAGGVSCSACRGGLGSGSSVRCALQCARVPRGGGSSERGDAFQEPAIKLIRWKKLSSDGLAQTTALLYHTLAGLPANVVNAIQASQSTDSFNKPVHWMFA